MHIVHRVSLSSTPQARKELSTLGVVIAGQGFVTFEFDEANEGWPSMKEWIAKRRPVDIISTTFSRAEVAEARWLELMPDWHCGYPQPKVDEFGYLAVTYDLANYCAKCGIGLTQKEPFQMSSEPKWGRRGILQLNWVFDEFFATPEVWAAVFKPLGVKSRPVTNTKGSQLKSVVQLVPEELVSVVTDGLPLERCATCGRVKYLPVARGPFPALRTEPRAAMAKTTEYFGSGAAADKRVVVSKVLARALDTAKIRGASLRPVSGTGSSIDTQFQKEHQVDLRQPGQG